MALFIEGKILLLGVISGIRDESLIRAPAWRPPLRCGGGDAGRARCAGAGATVPDTVAARCTLALSLLTGPLYWKFLNFANSSQTRRRVAPKSSKQLKLAAAREGEARAARIRLQRVQRRSKIRSHAVSQKDTNLLASWVCGAAGGARAAGGRARHWPAGARLRRRRCRRRRAAATAPSPTTIYTMILHYYHNTSTLPTKIT